MTKRPIAAGSSSIQLVDIKKLFFELGLKEDTIFLDLACGSGAYSIAASEYIGQTGVIYAIDLWKEGIESLQREIRSKKLKNIQASISDVSERIPIETDFVDVCLMATVLHDLIQDKTDVGTLKEVNRVLKPQGMLAIIEFKKIDGVPGPPLRIRLSPEEVETHLIPYSFRFSKTMNIGPYTYLSIFVKQHNL